MALCEVRLKRLHREPLRPAVEQQISAVLALACASVRGRGNIMCKVPMPGEIAANMIATAERFFRDAPYSEGPVTDEEDESGNWRFHGSGHYPRLADLIPPNRAEHCDQLFLKPTEFLNEIFVRLYDATAKNPSALAPRAAAISLLWQMRNTRVGADCYCERYDQELGDYRDDWYFEPDTSDWEPYRRLPSAWLARVVRLLDFSQCTDWERTRWEIQNASAAEDPQLARSLFRHADQAGFLPTPHLSAMRLQFEYLLVYGPEIDKFLRLPGYNDNIWLDGDDAASTTLRSRLRKLLATCRSEPSEPFSLPRLSFPPELFVPEVLAERWWDRGYWAVPIVWPGSKKVLTSERKGVLESACHALAGCIDSLVSSRGFYEAILAGCWDALGRADKGRQRRASALRHLSLLPSPWRDVCNIAADFATAWEKLSTTA